MGDYEQGYQRLTEGLDKRVVHRVRGIGPLRFLGLTCEPHRFEDLLGSRKCDGFSCVVLGDTGPFALKIMPNKSVE